MTSLSLWLQKLWAARLSNNHYIYIHSNIHFVQATIKPLLVRALTVLSKTSKGERSCKQWRKEGSRKRKSWYQEIDGHRFFLMKWYRTRQVPEQRSVEDRWRKHQEALLTVLHWDVQHNIPKLGSSNLMMLHFHQAFWNNSTFVCLLMLLEVVVYRPISGAQPGQRHL